MSTDFHATTLQERCMGGELFDFVNDFQTFHANGERSWRRTNTTEMLTVTEEHVAKMIRQILLAVDYMHSMDVVHRDLKLENVMLTEPFAADKEPEVKVVDLGFSRQVFGTTPSVALVSHTRLALACTAARSCGGAVTERRVNGGGGGGGGCAQADCVRACQVRTRCSQHAGRRSTLRPRCCQRRRRARGTGASATCGRWASCPTSSCAAARLSRETRLTASGRRFRRELSRTRITRW
jgi:serine/threonine protein kinase